MKKITVPEIRSAGRPLTMLTAYDFWTSQLVDGAGVDMILVGDSLGMVMLGYENTLSVTLDDMIHHARAVVRGSEHALVIGDMPYLTYHVSVTDTIRNAGRFICEAGVDAVKLEGGSNRVEMIKALIDAEIPVMGHLGLTPQSVNSLGGFKVQGKSGRAREKMKQEALILQDAGVFALVLECIPFDLAGEITESLSIPTIGIGAGPQCRGQVLVTHDMLGLQQGMVPKFVRQFANLGDLGEDAIRRYCLAVKEGRYPNLTESYGVKGKKKAARLVADEWLEAHNL